MENCISKRSYAIATTQQADGQVYIYPKVFGSLHKAYCFWKKVNNSTPTWHNCYIRHIDNTLLDTHEIEILNTFREGELEAIDNTKGFLCEICPNDAKYRNKNHWFCSEKCFKESKAQHENKNT